MGHKSKIGKYGTKNRSRCKKMSKLGGRKSRRKRWRKREAEKQVAKISGRSLQRHNLSAGRRSTLWQFNNRLYFLFSLSCISKGDLDSSSQILKTEGNNCDFEIGSISWLLWQQFCNRFTFSQGKSLLSLSYFHKINDHSHSQRGKPRKHISLPASCIQWTTLRNYREKDNVEQAEEIYDHSYLATSFPPPIDKSPGPVIRTGA